MQGYVRVLAGGTPTPLDSVHLILDVNGHFE